MLRPNLRHWIIHMPQFGSHVRLRLRLRLRLRPTLNLPNDLSVSTSLSAVPHDDLPQCRGSRRKARITARPPTMASTDRSETEGESTNMTSKAYKCEHNPFEAIFGNLSQGDKSASTMRCQFVRGVFAQSKSDVALFIDTGDRSGACRSYHVFLPFFGGPNDRLALEFVVQLCLNSKMTATVVRYIKQDTEVTSLERPEKVQAPPLPFPLAPPKDHSIGMHSVSQPAPFR